MLRNHKLAGAPFEIKRKFCEDPPYFEAGTLKFDPEKKEDGGKLSFSRLLCMNEFLPVWSLSYHTVCFGFLLISVHIAASS